MAKTPISAPNSGERGVALLEAAIALGLVAMIAAAGYGVFGRAAAVSARAEARLADLARAETAIERASSPAFLAEALSAGDAVMEGEGWRVDAAAMPEEAGPLALIRLTATAGAVSLETLRGTPR